MATHPKNNEYVRKWRLLNREKYLTTKRTIKYERYRIGNPNSKPVTVTFLVIVKG